MNVECATLHLLAMGVPPQTAEIVAQWMAKGPSLCLVYTKEATLVQTSICSQDMSHYALLPVTAVNANLGDRVVWHPQTGFNPEFRHSETSLT